VVDPRHANNNDDDHDTKGSVSTQEQLCSFFRDPMQCEEVLSLLTTTVWEEDAVTARIVRLRVCVIAGVDLQITRTVTEAEVEGSYSSSSTRGGGKGVNRVPAESTGQVDELESYSYLVREEGR
jgi:hypothetical protein